MGKNKSRGDGHKKNFKKDPIAVKVAGVRKSKTKAVNSNLKKINFQNRAITEKLDSQLSELMPAAAKTRAKATEGAASSQLVQAKISCDGPPPPDVNMAAEQMSKLAS